MRDGGSVMEHIHTYPDTLLMLDTLTTQSISQLLPAIAACDPLQHCVTICNVGSGLTGVINKHSLDTNDLATVMPYLRTVEPCDVAQVHTFIDRQSMVGQVNHHIYIRIPRDELPERLFPA